MMINYWACTEYSKVIQKSSKKREIKRFGFLFHWCWTYDDYDNGGNDYVHGDDYDYQKEDDGINEEH